MKEIDGIYEDYDPLIGWLPRPMTRTHININGDRIRKTTESTKQTGSQLFMFGGSTLWGMNVGDNETIPSLISRRKDSQHSSIGITNYGQIGYNINQEIAYLFQLLKQNKIPRMVVFYDGCNDLFYNLDSKNKNANVFYENRIQSKLGNILQYFQNEGPENLSIFDVDHIPQSVASIPTYLKIYYYPSKIIGKLLLRLGWIHPSGESEQILNDHNYADIVVDNYRNNARVIDTLSRAYGFQYALLWQPLVYTKTHVTENERSSYSYSPLHPEIMYHVITNRLQREHIKNFYDLSGAFDDQTASLFYDECHITPQGNEIIAQKIADILQKDFGL